MRTVSSDFTAAEESNVQQHTLTVTVQRNAEALEWTKPYSYTGLAGVWQGIDATAGLEGQYGSAYVTPAGTLIRTYSVDVADNPDAPLYINRVPANTADADMQDDLNVWTQLAQDTIPLCRECVSADNTRVRIFFVQYSNTYDHGVIVYIDSLNDGLTWSAPTIVNTVERTQVALASPRPDMLFLCYRATYEGSVPGDTVRQGLQLVALQKEATEWLETFHPIPLPYDNVDSPNTIWNGAFHFDAALTPEGVAQITEANTYATTSSQAQHTPSMLNNLKNKNLTASALSMTVGGSTHYGIYNNALLGVLSETLTFTWETPRWIDGFVIYTVASDTLTFQGEYTATDSVSYGFGANGNGDHSVPTSRLLREYADNTIAAGSGGYVQESTIADSGVYKRVYYFGDASAVGSSRVAKPIYTNSLQISFNGATNLSEIIMLVQERAQDSSVCVSVLNDIAGRPASTTFQSRFWSDYFSVEAIDFADPERDEVRGLRLGVWDNKLILTAHRTLADTDFTTLRQGCYYYSIDGKRWSKPYYVDESSQWNWGVPLLWRNQLWIVGNDSLFMAPQTALFGGNPGLQPDGSTLPTAQDITASFEQITVDEPEDRFGAARITGTIKNTDRAYNMHPLVTDGNEITVSAGYAGTEQVLMAQGIVDPLATGASLSITAYDVLANLARGQVDDPASYTIPERYTMDFTTDGDLAMMPATQGAWAIAQEDGAYFARAQQQDANTMSRSSGIAGAITFSARVRIVNPNVGTVTGAVNTNVNAAIAVNTDLGFTTGYVVRFGRGLTRFQLFKRVANVGYHVRTSNAVTVPDVPINSWFRVGIIQIGRTLRCFINSPLLWGPTPYELFSFTDDSPLDLQSGMAISCRLPATAPASDALDQDYETFDVDDIRVNGHSPTTLLEEYLGALAIQRGFEAIIAEQVYDTSFANLSGWTIIGSPSAWLVTLSGVVHNNVGSTLSETRAIIREELYALDLAVDVTMTLARTSNPSDVGQAWSYGRLGVIGRADLTGDSYVAFTVNAAVDTLVNGSYMISTPMLQIVENGLVTSLQSMTTMHPVFPGRQTIFRFVVDGPWYMVYANDTMLAAFHATKLMRYGYWGLTGGYDLDHGESLIRRFKVARFGFGTPPLINPGDTLDKPLKAVLEPLNGYARALGRTLYAGTQLVSTDPIVATDVVWTGYGYDAIPARVITRMRVRSTTEDGTEISGTASAINLLSKYKRDNFASLQIDGLKTEAECRTAAKQKLAEQVANTRKRVYPLAPRLTWERFDTIQATNTKDDTAVNVLLTGTERTWKQEAGGWKVEMKARLQEDTAPSMQYSTEYPPDT